MILDQDYEFYDVLATYINEKKGLRTIFIAEQYWEATFYRTKKKKIVMYVMYVFPHISNRILDFFFENYPRIISKNQNGV